MSSLPQPGRVRIGILRMKKFWQCGYICATLSLLKTTTIRARIEPALKEEVETILSTLGLTSSETIQLLYRQIKLRKGLPFAVEIPNERTAVTLRDSKSGKGVRHFATKEELYADLGL